MLLEAIHSVRADGTYQSATEALRDAIKGYYPKHFTVFAYCIWCGDEWLHPCPSNNCQQCGQRLDIYDVCCVCNEEFERYKGCRTARQGKRYCAEHRPSPSDGGFRKAMVEAAITAHRRDGLGQDIMTARQRTVLRAFPCVYCGVEPSDDNPIHADHIYPSSRGGWEVWQNFVPACRSCNQYKGNKTLLEWELKRPDLVFHARMVNVLAAAAYEFEKHGKTTLGLEMPPVQSKWRLTRPRSFSKWAIGVAEPRQVNMRMVSVATQGIPLWRYGNGTLPDYCYDT